MPAYELESSLIARGVLEPRAVSDPATPYAPYIPPRLTLQWHITDRCNLACRHCYMPGPPGEDPSLGELARVLERYAGALRRMNIPGRINVTGGEPLLRDDLFDLLGLFHRYDEIHGFGILTNGVLVDGAMAGRLKKSGCSFVQVSIDGGKREHDAVRGEGNFERSMRAVRILRRKGLRALISFTAGAYNFRSFPDLVREARRARCDIVWADRLIPAGLGASLAGALMTPEEVEEFFREMRRCRAQLRRRPFGKTSVQMARALQFLALEDGDELEVPYRCPAGDTVITVLPDGKVLPCRRMPVIVGDLKSRDLFDIYQGSGLLTRLRRRDEISAGCGDCGHSRFCGGGLRCLSYAMHGDPFIRDPQCFYRRTEARVPPGIPFPDPEGSDDMGR